MRVVPRNQSPQIEFFTAHVPIWTERAEEIGTTPELVAQLQAEVDAAREAFKARQRAESAAKSATLKAKIARDAMLTTGAAIISQVRVKAAMDGVGIYSLASIDVPKQPSPIAEPGEPTEFRHAVSSDGRPPVVDVQKSARGGGDDLSGLPAHWDDRPVPVPRPDGREASRTRRSRPVRAS